MIYEVRTLDIGSKLYKVSGYPTINMKEIVKYQRENPPKQENKDWAYSLYFSDDPNVCAGYIVDYDPAYLIEITLKRPIEYIFTDDSKFSTGGVSSIYMESTVVPYTSEAIYKHTLNRNLSLFHYPDISFMQELGDKRFAFSDIMAIEMNEKGKNVMLHEIIIPHVLLNDGVFTQRNLDYKMNDRMNGFEWIKE